MANNTAPPVTDLTAQFAGAQTEPSIAPTDPNPIVPSVTDLTAQFSKAPQATGAAAPQAIPQTPVTDLTKSFTIQNQISLSDEERKQSDPNTDPLSLKDEPWYSATWDWMNKPLYDAHQWGVRTGAGTVERGVESGVEDLISGLTSPLSIGLTIGTLGGGTVADLGANGLRAIGISKEAAPFVARGIKSLVDLGFTTQAVSGLVTQSPQFLDALKDGDYETAARLGTNILATGAMTALGAKKTFEDAGVVKDAINGKTASTIDTLKATRALAGDFDLAKRVAGEHAQGFAEELKKDLDAAKSTDEISQIGIRKYMLDNGDLEAIRNRHNALEGTLPVKQTPEISTEVANPSVKDFGEQKNLENYIETQHGGSISAANTELAKNFDTVQYTKEDGTKVAVQLKPAAQIPTKRVWDQDYVYRAVDPRFEDMIRNAGLKPGEYHATPEDAIANATLPTTGKREDLRVFAVPRSEATGENFAYRSRDVGETGVPSKSHSQATMSEDEARKYMADRAKIQGDKTRGNKPKAQELVRIDLSKLKSEDFTRKAGPNQVDWVKFNRDLAESEIEKAPSNKANILPSHEVVIDNGKPTGQVVPLRGNAPMTLDNTRFQSEYTPEEKENLLAGYKKALNLTPEQIAIAKKLRTFYEEQFNNAHNAGMIRQAIENYHPQAWAKDRPGFFDSLFGVNIDPADNSAFSQLRHQTDNGAFDTNITAAKHRAFETEFQGEMAGYKAKSSDLAYHAADYQNRLEKAIAARKLLDDMAKRPASDGRPLVALSGAGKTIGEESGNPALLINPNAARDVMIKNEDVQKLMKNGKLKELVDSGKIEQLPFTREFTDPKTGEKAQVPAFTWSTNGYQTIDHPAMRDWAYIGKDTGGANTLLKAQMRVHPEAANYVRQVIGADTSAFKQNPYLRALMAAQRETKGALLAFSPFHAVQEGLRAVMLGINPFDWSPVHVEGDELLMRGVRNNLTFPDYKAEDAFTEGVASHSRLIGKIPMANKLQDYIQRFTFDKLIPSLKARAFKSVYYRFLDRMPGAGADEVAHQAATYVNDVFGGQHWRDLGISATGQDAMRSIALAPDWLTSEMRMLYRAAGGMGKPARQIAQADMLRLTAGLFVAARVINMLNTGKPHAEAPFGLVVPGKNGEDDKVYSLRTLPTDLVHALSDPQGFIRGRVNPLTVRTGIEAVEGRDEFGRRVTPGQEVRDLIQNFVPIGGQGLMKGGAPGGLTELDQLAKAAGTTVYKYRTEAEKLAQEKASDRMPSGPVDPSELAVHQRNLRLEDGLRNGTISRGQVRRLTSAREAEQLIKNANRTGLQARFDRLPLRDALSVWELATPSEKDQLHKILWSKRVAYIQSHSPAERNSDPTWVKMQKVYADLHSR